MEREAADPAQYAGGRPPQGMAMPGMARGPVDDPNRPREKPKVTVKFVVQEKDVVLMTLNVIDSGVFLLRRS